MDREEPIRVLQIVGIACNGGVEAVVLNYYRHMDKDKVQFDFVVHKNPAQNFVDEVKKGGGRLYEVTPYTKNIFAFTYEIYQIIKKGKYNVVHTNMNSLSGFPLLAAYLAGARVRILHNHTTDVKSEGLRTLLKRVLRPFAKLFANRYFACSELAASWMYGKEAVKNGRVTIIPNAIDLEMFAFNPEKRNELRNVMGMEDKLVLGHIGRFVYQKNHLFLIDVFARVVEERRDAMLLLIGDGPLRKQMEEKVDALGISDRVLFLGNRNDVSDLYNVMDVFVLPSFYEGLPVVAVEAQANGLKCLFSDKVTLESKLLSETECIALNVEEWKQSLCNLAPRVLNERGGIELMQKFDIRESSILLSNRYIMENNTNIDSGG